jgi:hypothetical protein
MRTQVVTIWKYERGNITPQKNRPAEKCKDSDDPEHLQAMDENNAEWVAAWKRTVKKKTE